MVTITTGKKILTLINVFTVQPEDQQRLIDILIEADEKIQRRPGYISASFHRGLNGTTVTNYTQWESEDTLNAMLQDPEAAEHIQAIKRLVVRFEPVRYEVVYTAEATI